MYLYITYIYMLYRYIYIYRQANGIYINNKYISQKVAIYSLWTVCPCYFVCLYEKFYQHLAHNLKHSIFINGIKRLALGSQGRDCIIVIILYFIL